MHFKIYLSLQISTKIGFG